MHRAQRSRLLMSAVVLLAAGGSAAGQDRSGYTLFNPTPDHLLRDLTTDRPDLTETPFTVDAGHIQIESNLFGYARSGRDAEGAIVETYEIAITNVRIGLTNNLEAGFIWQPYGIVRTMRPDPLGTLHQSGIGGLQLRGKVNLWGNDTYGKPGSSALALLPFVTLPTDRHNGISPEFADGGLVVPFAVKLTDKFSLGITAGVVRIRTDATTAYHTEFLGSASLGYEWSDTFGTYYEVATRLNTDDPRGDTVVLGTGFTYRLGKNVQFDMGVNFGVTPAADRINPFVGLTKRF
jgi:Putative MetA-pathway of phenol degradation